MVGRCCTGQAAKNVARLECALSLLGIALLCESGRRSMQTL